MYITAQTILSAAALTGAVTAILGGLFAIYRWYQQQNKQDEFSFSRKEIKKQRMAEYKHNHLLFLSNPFVESDSNLCERKTKKEPERIPYCHVLFSHPVKSNHSLFLITNRKNTPLSE